MKIENPIEGVELVETVVEVRRHSKVVKGGRRFGFSALVVCGDKQGSVGFGTGKAKEVPDAIKKGILDAKKNMRFIVNLQDTVPHAINSKFKGAQVVLRPASPGTGIISAGGVRAVLEAVGVKNILTKSLGSSNALCLVHATMRGLGAMCTQEHIRQLRFENKS